MDFAAYLEKIGALEEGKESFWSIHEKLTSPDFENIIQSAFAAYDKGDESFEAFLLPLVEVLGYPVEVLTLYFYIRISERTYEDYKARGIDSEIFFSSMDDFTVASRYSLERSGIYGIPSWPDRPWERLILEGKIYRLGRLQFELYNSPLDAEIDGVKIQKGEPCINVHIPGYMPLREEDCEESYELARKFFKKYYGLEKCVFVCDSWLLAPWLSEVLSENSGIVRFQKKYKIATTSDDASSAILYVFAKKQENIADYPEDTTLRRLLKERLLKSLPTGTALGFRL